MSIRTYFQTLYTKANTYARAHEYNLDEKKKEPRAQLHIGHSLTSHFSQFDRAAARHTARRYTRTRKERKRADVWSLYEDVNARARRIPVASHHHRVYTQHRGQLSFRRGERGRGGHCRGRKGTNISGTLSIAAERVESV